MDLSCAGPVIFDIEAGLSRIQREELYQVDRLLGNNHRQLAHDSSRYERNSSSFKLFISSLNTSIHVDIFKWLQIHFYNFKKNVDLSQLAQV